MRTWQQAEKGIKHIHVQQVYKEKLAGLLSNLVKVKCEKVLRLMCSHKYPTSLSPLRPVLGGTVCCSTPATHYVLKNWKPQNYCFCHRCQHRKLRYVPLEWRVEGVGQPAPGLTFLKSLKIHVAEKHTSKNIRSYSEVQLFTCMHYFYMYVSTA